MPMPCNSWNLFVKRYVLEFITSFLYYCNIIYTYLNEFSSSSVIINRCEFMKCRIKLATRSIALSCITIHYISFGLAKHKPIQSSVFRDLRLVFTKDEWFTDLLGSGNCNDLNLNTSAVLIKLHSAYVVCRDGCYFIGAPYVQCT